MKLIKQHIVVYDENNIIMVKSDNNAETVVGKGRKGAEFDTREELEQFITSKELKEFDYATMDD